MQIPSDNEDEDKITQVIRPSGVERGRQHITQGRMVGSTSRRSGSRRREASTCHDEGSVEVVKNVSKEKPKSNASEAVTTPKRGNLKMEQQQIMENQRQENQQRKATSPDLHLEINMV